MTEGCALKQCLEDLAAAVVGAEIDDAESLATLARRLAAVEQAAKADEVSDEVAAALEDLLTAGQALAASPEASDLQHIADAVDELQKRIASGLVANGKDGAHGQQGAGRAAAAPGVAAFKERDADTIALIGEFLSESEEGLSRADQILMTVEESGATPDAINGLFRVFHTTKGVAGFLELFAIQSLAHTTESLLNACREGLCALAGERLDVVFDATATMRKLLGELATAVESSREFSTAQDIPALVARLQAAIEADTDASPAVISERPAAPAAGRSVAPTAASASEPALVTPDEPSGKSASEPAPTPANEPSTATRTGGAEAADTKLRPTIKIDLERVDRLVEMIGELVVVEAMVVGAPEIAHSASARVRNCLSQLAKVTHDLQDVGMRMRMLPVAGVFQKMARVARDVGRKAGKQVRVVLSGEQTEMDRSMVEQISDPLLHMIRNSIDHGIEPPELRRQAGKPEEGKVRLSAYHEGGHVVIEIADDGRGLNRDAILAKARSQGLVQPGDSLSEAEIHTLIFAPGFSTAEKVTDISGRGVGMDVVRRNIDAMRGRIAIQTAAGQGTTFKITLPLTLAIIDGMLVACGRERYILPTLSVVESIQPEASMLLTHAGKGELLNMRGTILPLLRLDRLLGTQGAVQDPRQGLVVIVEGLGRRVGLLVDEVVAQQQVVIKTMGEGMGEVPLVSGAAILSDGRVGLIVNVEGIVSLVAERRHRGFAADLPLAGAA